MTSNSTKSFWSVFGLWSWCLLVPTLALLGLVPFDVVVLGLLLGLLGALVLSAGALNTYRVERVWDPNLTWALPLAALLVPLFLWGAIAFPWLRDVSTKLDSPPHFTKLEPVESPGAVTYDEAEKSAIRRAWPKLGPVTHTSKQMEVLGRALIAAKKLPGWQTTFYDFRGDRIEGTTRSPWLGLTTQVVIQVLPQSQSSTRGVTVDMRARSLTRFGDFGQSARILTRLKRQFAESWICKPGESKK